MALDKPILAAYCEVDRTQARAVVKAPRASKLVKYDLGWKSSKPPRTRGRVSQFPAALQHEYLTEGLKVFYMELFGGHVLEAMDTNLPFNVEEINLFATMLLLVVILLQFIENRRKNEIDTRPMIIMDPNRSSIQITNNEIKIPFINIGKITARNLKVEYCTNIVELNNNFDKNQDIQHEEEQDILPQEKIYQHFPIDQEYLNENIKKIYFMFRITYDRSSWKGKNIGVYTRTFTFKNTPEFFNCVPLHHMRAIDTK